MTVRLGAARLGIFILALSVVVCAGLWRSGYAAAPAIPSFTVDTGWPQPLPNNWSVGPVSGIAVDRHDHVWIVHRTDPVKQAGGTPAPPVIEFDQRGAIVQTWGSGPGQGYQWPQQVHGISVDAADRVWISGNGETDAHILAFTARGALIRQIGHAGRAGGSNDTENLGRATQMRFDASRREVFVSDGEMNLHHRVIVFDSETGAYRRHWGAYGARPDDTAVAARSDGAAPPRQFGAAVHCLRIDRDGLVYVCDRSNNRFQVFRKDGTFVKEVFVARETAGAGSVWDIDFSPDQLYMYVADGTNQKVWVLSRRDLSVVTSFGGAGADAGHFATSLHDIAVDSRGNLYTGEAATGGRVQKFAVQSRRAAVASTRTP